MHWSTPFLGSVPARTTAARNLTTWARRAGSRVTVTGVSSGFQVATASGARRLLGDLGAVADQLAREGLERRALLGGAVLARVVEGPPTRPPERLNLSPVRADHPAEQGAEGEVVTTLPGSARRPCRVPALLAWLAVADGVGVLGAVRLELDLGMGTGLELLVSDDSVTCCRARRTTGPDRLITANGSAPLQLVQVLG